MDKKRRVEVVINGQSHAFVTSDGDEYIKGLADYLNEKINEVTASSFGNLLSNDKKYIVTAMNILDDYYKILAKHEEVSEKMNASPNNAKKISEDYEKKLKETVKGYETGIKALQKENTKLKEKLESTEYELKYVQNLYKEQKQEYEEFLENATKPEK